MLFFMVDFSFGTSLGYEPSFRYSSIDVIEVGDEKHLFRVNVDEHTIEHYILVEKKIF